MSHSIWRSAGRVPSVLGIPCIAYMPIFLWLFHMRWWTFWTALGFIVFFAVLSWFGLTFRVLWAKSLHLLRGGRVHARPWWYRNRFLDRD
ncbi:IcmT/TraK family protein [Rugamonas apoptosis]|uniref:Conjugal transfer protein TraK n=1 Tax=Rugamonas apoptosis TaxID=2758570 RepID=A0A7W2F8T9_9BURK|nr:IcmT/TraK family protein [Rugamonas apoptosis]MBA5687232.1 conjugal transfer protein TraK [Rugamonas apoptosis]